MVESQGFFDLKHILSETDYSHRKSKIVCTIGPSCWDVPTLCKMLEAGMNVARLNFSHGTHEGHGEVVGRLREAFKQKKHLSCAIMLDTKGPEIRTGFFANGAKNIELQKDQELEITTDYDFKGDNTKIACSYKNLTKSVKPGSQILIADGSLVCVVKEVKDTSVIVNVQNNAKIGERKNMNLPGAVVDLPTVTDKDKDDIQNFGLKHGVDLIALSFARSAKDIEQVRDILGPKGSEIKIIAKIENQEGLHNYEQILQSADGIMIARGDLGMEIPPQKVFVAQKMMIRKAIEAGKPIITATQMMESMINNPRPTRAEASDVANAILDGSDATMLSGETANGSFSVQCVETMSRICVEAELCSNRQEQFWQRTHGISNITPQKSLSISAVQMSFQLKASAIIVFTYDGDMARYISQYRPQSHIIAVSTENGTIKALTIQWGVTCLRVPSFQGIDKLIEYAMIEAIKQGLCKKGDRAIIVQDQEEEDEDQSSLIKIQEIK